jgi:hypothetical protein
MNGIGRLLAVCALLLATSAGAQTSKPVVAEGRGSVVAKSDKPFTEVSATLGTVNSQPAKGAAGFELLYTPEARTSGSVGSVRFATGDEPAKTLLVDIVPADGAMGGAYEPVFKALFALFVVAVILEAALALIFNWRVFLQVFDSRGAKTLISFLLALALVKAFGLDILARIVALLWEPGVKSDWLTQTLSAMVLAGGSGAVNNLLVALNFRSVRSAVTLEPKPPPTMGWISVRLTRDRAKKGPVALEIKEQNGAYVRLYQFNGHDTRPPLLKGLLRDVMRYPPGGGFSVAPDVPLHIRLVGDDGGPNPVVYEHGPFSIARGGMVDIEAKV